MSLILKGIDIPKDGYIPMRIYANGHIWINGSYKGVAIQIPKGHGDIKDVSEFIKAVDHALDVVWIKDDYLDEDMRQLLRDTKKRIEKLPTILEAEE